MMGGDLVSTSQRAWFSYIAANMNDLFDAYSVHIYWDYWDTPFFKETRLEGHPQDRHRGAAGVGPQADLRDGVRRPRQELPREAERRVRLLGRRHGASPARTWPRSNSSGSILRRLSSASRARSSGTRTGAGTTARTTALLLIGPAAEGWPLFPGYHATNLLLQTTARGWQVLQVGPWDEDDWKVGVIDQAEKELTAYAGAGGQLTLMGLDSRGRDLNTVSPESPEYSIGGLPANTQFGLAALERDGRRQELDRGHRHHQRRRRGALPGATAGSVRADERPRFLTWGAMVGRGQPRPTIRTGCRAR